MDDVRSHSSDDSRKLPHTGNVTLHHLDRGVKGAVIGCNPVTLSVIAQDIVTYVGCHGGVVADTGLHATTEGFGDMQDAGDLPRHTFPLRHALG